MIIENQPQTIYNGYQDGGLVEWDLSMLDFDGDGQLSWEDYQTAINEYEIYTPGMEAGWWDNYVDLDSDGNLNNVWWDEVNLAFEQGLITQEQVDVLQDYDDSFDSGGMFGWSSYDDSILAQSVAEPDENSIPEDLMGQFEQLLESSGIATFSEGIYEEGWYSNYSSNYGADLDLAQEALDSGEITQDQYDILVAFDDTYDPGTMGFGIEWPNWSILEDSVAYSELNEGVDDLTGITLGDENILDIYEQLQEGTYNPAENDYDINFDGTFDQADVDILDILNYDTEIIEGVEGGVYDEQWDWIQGPYEGGELIDPDTLTGLEFEVSGTSNEGFYWQWNPEIEDWEAIYLQEEDMGYEDPGYEEPPDIGTEYQVDPWYEQTYGWDGWWHLPHETRQHIEQIFGDPSDWLNFDTPGIYEDPDSPYQAGDTPWDDYDDPYWDEANFWNNIDLFEVFNPYDPGSIQAIMAAKAGWFPGWTESGSSVSQGLQDFSESEFWLNHPYNQWPGWTYETFGQSGQSVPTDMTDAYHAWNENPTWEMLYDDAANYLESLGGWDPAAIRGLTPEMFEKMELGYYDPMMETARRSSVSNVMSDYGENIGDVLNPARYEQLMQQQIQTGLVDPYSQVQSGQQAGLEGIQEIIDDWSEAIMGLGIDTSTTSDIALKENIELVGKSPSGINIYEFDYKDKSYGKDRYRGVMAQEVPEASIMADDGYLRVYYDKIDVVFEKVIGE